MHPPFLYTGAFSDTQNKGLGDMTVMGCKTPVRLDDGTMVACRICWQCRLTRVEDWTGRCIAESKTSYRTLVCTLTYGEDDHYQVDHAKAHLLTYSDVVSYLKLLRKHTGGGVRFFVTGEYGSKKGRAHWHMIAFFEKAVPPNLELERRYMHHWRTEEQAMARSRNARWGLLWRHGWSYWKEGHPDEIQYALKYVTKELETGGEKAFGLSKSPPLGTAYFVLEAQRYVQQGLSPQDLYYRFPEVVDREGKSRWFKLAGASAYGFLNAFDRLWQTQYGNDRWPQSDLMDVYVDERDRRFRREMGEPDWPDDRFNERERLIQLEKRGQWLEKAEAEAAVNEAPLTTKREYKEKSQGW